MYSACSSAAYRRGGLCHHRLQLRDGACCQEPGRLTQGSTHLAAAGQPEQERQRLHQETGCLYQVSEAIVLDYEGVVRTPTYKIYCTLLTWASQLLDVQLQSLKKTQDLATIRIHGH